jgi:hypothetical protein
VLAGLLWPGAPQLLDVVAAALVLLALLTAVAGPWHVDVAGLPISASRTSRLLLEALAVALIGLCVRPTRGRSLLPVAIGALCLCASAESRPRRVGDGHEYAVMALNLARLERPALTGAEAREWEDRLHAWDSGDVLQSADLEAAGRFDQPHFWAYSLLAAPFVAAAQAAGLSWTVGFVVLNALLLAAAALAFQWAGASPASALLLTASPILWWVDKVHTEALVFFLLTIAVCAWPRSPGASILALGGLAAQNPAALAPLAGALVLGGRRVARGSVRGWIAAGAGPALAAAPIVYSAIRIGRPLPLASATLLHVPGPAEILAPVLDLNVGLLWAFPALGVVVLRALTSRTRLDEAGRCLFALVTAGSLLAVFAQTTNVNHGGTPGPSRYGLWLIPLALPLVLETERDLGPRQRRAWAVLCASSFVFSLVVFAPRRPEAHLAPSSVAAWVWRHAPSLDSPLPEIFVERVVGRDGALRLPVATSDCDKVLAVRRGTGAWWPIRCAPSADPPPSPSPKLRYANRAGSGWRWAPVPDQPAFRPERTDEAAWTPPRDGESRRLLGALEWDGLREIAVGDPRSDVSSRRRTGRLVAYQGAGVLLVWVPRPRPEAELRADLAGPAWGAVFDASSGATLERLAGEGTVTVRLPPGRACVVVLRAR